MAKEHDGEKHRPHLIDGEFQSDKYPSTPRGKVPLSTKDKNAQDLLWMFAQRHRSKDPEFSDDLEEALRLKGFDPNVGECCGACARYEKVVAELKQIIDVGRAAHNEDRVRADTLARELTEARARVSELEFKFARDKERADWCREYHE